MKDDKRRKVLKALAIGAPAVWGKPTVDSVLLPAHANTTSGAGCIQFTSVSYVDFGGGNYIPPTTLFGQESDCSNPNTTVGCLGLAYAPGGLADAQEICNNNLGGTATQPGPFINDVYACGCGS